VFRSRSISCLKWKQFGLRSLFSLYHAQIRTNQTQIHLGIDKEANAMVGLSFRILGLSALSIVRLAATTAAPLLSEVPDFVPASV
jgi:hypothetical protein